MKVSARRKKIRTPASLAPGPATHRPGESALPAISLPVLPSASATDPANARKDECGPLARPCEALLGGPLARPPEVPPDVLLAVLLGVYDEGNGLVLDSLGNAYIGGWTESSNFPTTAGAFQTTLSGLIDAFVAKFNPALSGSASLVYSTLLGGSGKDGTVFTGGGPDRFWGAPLYRQPAIAVDSAGDAYIAGETNSANFPTTPGAFQTQLAPGSSNRGDAFVTKLNASGSALVYSTYLGGSATDGATDIVVDDNGNATVTGFTDSTNFPLKNAIQTKLQSGYWSDAFVTTLNSSGSALLFSTYLGYSGNGGGPHGIILSGTPAFIGSGVTLDSSGNVYVASFIPWYSGEVFKISSPTSSPLSLGIDSPGFVATDPSRGLLAGLSLTMPPSPVFMEGQPRDTHATTSAPIDVATHLATEPVYLADDHLTPDTHLPFTSELADEVMAGWNAAFPSAFGSAHKLPWWID